MYVYIYTIEYMGIYILWSHIGIFTGFHAHEVFGWFLHRPLAPRPGQIGGGSGALGAGGHGDHGRGRRKSSKITWWRTTHGSFLWVSSPQLFQWINPLLIPCNHWGYNPLTSRGMSHQVTDHICLVVSNMNFIFHFIYGMSSFPLTNSIIFQDGYCTTNQMIFCVYR